MQAKARLLPQYTTETALAGRHSRSHIARRYAPPDNVVKLAQKRLASSAILTVLRGVKLDDVLAVSQGM